MSSGILQWTITAQNGGIIFGLKPKPFSFLSIQTCSKALPFASMDHRPSSNVTTSSMAWPRCVLRASSTYRTPSHLTFALDLHPWSSPFSLWPAANCQSQRSSFSSHLSMSIAIFISLVLTNTSIPSWHRWIAQSGNSCRAWKGEEVRKVEFLFATYVQPFRQHAIDDMHLKCLLMGLHNLASVGVLCQLSLARALFLACFLKRGTKQRRRICNKARKKR